MAGKNGSLKRKETFNQDVPLFDELIGTDENGVRLTAYVDVQETINDYQRKLQSARGIPFDRINLTPLDPLIQYVADTPEVSSMPEKTDRERQAKSRLVYDTIQDYYNRQAESCQRDAVILALTLDNEFKNEPEAYPEGRKNRVRPGIIDMPIIIPNLFNPVERRLKQALDKLASIPGGIDEIAEHMQLLSIKMRLWAAETDKDGFRPESTD